MLDAQAFARIWIYLLTTLNVMRGTLSISTKYNNEYQHETQTENFNSAIPTEWTEPSISTPSIRNVYMNPEMAIDRRRYYRNSNSMASVESRVAPESDNPLELNDMTEKYNSSSVTELTNIDKTVIPLTSTKTYDSFETSPQTESIMTDTVIPNISTEKYDILLQNNTTVQPIKFLRDNLNQVLESVTTSNQLFNQSKNNSIVADQVMPVLGIDYYLKKERKPERTMILPSSKETKYLWVIDTVHNMAKDAMLKNETEDYVIQLHSKCEEMPLVEADNFLWTKYARTIAETFVLDFCRNYPRRVTSHQIVTKWQNADEYSRIYNTTLSNLQQKKEQTAIEFAAPVRRVADIYKAILDTPIGIVQSKCKVDMPKWLCLAEYVVRLADISETCEYIWFHAQVHLTVLQSIRNAKGAKDPANEIIAELNSRLPEVGSNNDVNYLFDFIINTLSDLGKRLKDPLLSQASLYNLIKELQQEDKLKCLSIDEQML